MKQQGALSLVLIYITVNTQRQATYTRPVE